MFNRNKRTEKGNFGEALELKVSLLLYNGSDGSDTEGEKTSGRAFEGCRTKTGLQLIVASSRLLVSLRWSDIPVEFAGGFCTRTAVWESIGFEKNKRVKPNNCLFYASKFNLHFRQLGGSQSARATFVETT